MAPGIFQLGGAIVFLWDDSEVSIHDPGNDVGVFLTPFIVIALALVRPFDVIGRSVWSDTFLRSALFGNQVVGILLWFPSQLPHDRALIADQPFVVDLVAHRMAVGNDPVAELLTCRRAVHTRMGVGCCRVKPMR